MIHGNGMPVLRSAKTGHAKGLHRPRFPRHALASWCV